MKKTLSLAALTVIGLSSVFTYAAQSPAPVDLDNVFRTEFEFGYTENTNITVEGFKSTLSGEVETKTFAVNTPFIKDAMDANAESYVLALSPYPMKDYLDGTRNPNLEEITLKQYTPTENDVSIGSLKINLAREDLKNTSANQYAFIIPTDNNFQEGQPSKQFCFNFTSEKYAEGDACNTFGTSETSNTEDVLLNTDENGEEHAAAGADMNLAGVSHSVKGNVITLTWAAQEASSSLEIQLLDKVSKDFKVLGTVPMSQEKFDYTIEGNTQEFIFHLVPKDAAGKEKRYDINVRTESEVTPEIKTTPKVGPVEDMMLMVAITIALYAGYRVVASRKAE